MMTTMISVQQFDPNQDISQNIHGPQRIMLLLMTVGTLLLMFDVIHREHSHSHISNTGTWSVLQRF